MSQRLLSIAEENSLRLKVYLQLIYIWCYIMAASFSSQDTLFVCKNCSCESSDALTLEFSAGLKSLPCARDLYTNSGGVKIWIYELEKFHDSYND